MIVERLVVGIGYQVDRASEAAAKSSYGTIAAGIATAAVAAGAFAIALAAQDDKIAKTAAGLGLLTEDYTALTYAADRSGLAVEEMNAGLGALQGKLGEAARGSSETAALFASLGVKVTDSTGKVRTAADVLPEIADGLQAMGTEGQRADARLRLLGEGGRKWAPLLAGGSEQIEALTDRARELGVVLDSDAAKQSERLMDAITDLRGVATGFARELGTALIPRLADGTEHLVEWLAASDGIARTASDRAVRSLGYAFGALETPAGKAAGALGVALAVLKGAKGASGMADAVGKVSPALGGLAKGLGALALPAAKVAIPLALVALAIDDIIVTAEGGDSVIRRMADTLGIGEEVATGFANVGLLVREAWGPVGILLSQAADLIGDRLAYEWGLFVEDLQQAQGIFASVRGWLTDNADAIDYTLGPLDEMIGAFGLLEAILTRIEAIDLSGWFSELPAPIEGFRKAAAYAAGSENVGVRESGGGIVGGFLAAPAVGLLARQRAQAVGAADPNQYAIDEMRKNGDRWKGQITGGASATVNVTVANARAIVDEAARAVRKATQEQLYAAGVL